MKRLSPTILLVLVVSLACAAPSVAARSDKEIATAILKEYVGSGGRLNACNFTIAELKRVKAAIPVDNRQYGAAFVAAIDDALAARAQGACDRKKQNATAPAVATQTPPPAAGTTPPPAGSSGTTPPAQTATPGVPAPAQAPPTPTAEPSPATAVATDNSIALASRTNAGAPEPPVPVLLLVIIAALLAAAALAFALVRFLAWEPLWAVRFRHAAGEAGWRASSTFSEFTDFVRMGR